MHSQSAAPHRHARTVVVDAYLNAFAQLNGHEIAAMALTLAILCLRGAQRHRALADARAACRTENRARDEIIACRAEVDRVYALLRSEPQILVAWAAADDEPEIIGDIGLVADAEAPHRVLAFGLWLDPEKAQAMEGAVSALRERGEKFACRSSHSPAARSRPKARSWADAPSCG